MMSLQVAMNSTPGQRCVCRGTVCPAGIRVCTTRTISFSSSSLWWARAAVRASRESGQDQTAFDVCGMAEGIDSRCPPFYDTSVVGGFRLQHRRAALGGQPGAAVPNLTFYCFSQGGSGKDARGVQHGERGLLGRHQQRDFGAGQSYGVAAFVFQAANHFREISLRARQERSLDEFVKDDPMNALALLRSRDAVLDAGGLQRLAVDRTIHQRARAEDSEALVAMPFGFGGDLDRDVQPRTRGAMFNQIESLMHGVDGSDEEVSAGLG